MSTLSFGIWGATTKVVPTLEYTSLRQPLDTTFVSSKTYTLARTSGPQQLVLVEDGTNISTVVTSSDRPITQSINTTTSAIPHAMLSGVENCTVAQTGPTSSTDMRMDWFDILSAQGCHYLLKTSPYSGISPTIIYNGGAAAPTTVDAYIDNAGERTRRQVESFTFTSLPGTIPRTTGYYKLFIKNPDGTRMWFDVDGRMFGSALQSGIDFRYAPHIRRGTTPVRCTVTTSTTQVSTTFQISSATGGYVYNLLIPNNDSPSTLSLDTTSTAIGGGQNVRVDVIYYLDL
jgi:hypothetical protein